MSRHSGISDFLLVRQGEKYSKKYIKLFQSFNPVTLTDQSDTPGKTRNLRNNYQGWTAKMELFAPWNSDLRPAFYADLDTYILWDISDILKTQINELWLIRDFYNPERSNSGLMLIPKDTSNIWQAFLNHNMNPFRDGCFLNQFPHKVMQDHFAGIKSYKADSLQETPEGRIICFHGKPRPHQTEGWAKEYWNEITES